MKYEDFRGTEIKVGSGVVYAQRKGSSLWMEEGTVVELTTQEGWHGGPYPAIKVRKIKEDGSMSERISKLSRLDRVTVVA
jgi:hypothetical protein